MNYTVYHRPHGIGAGWTISRNEVQADGSPEKPFLIWYGAADMMALAVQE